MKQDPATRRIVTVLVAMIALLGSACSGTSTSTDVGGSRTAESADASETATEPTAAPTSAPEPTAVPEPTEEPTTQATTEPTPEAPADPCSAATVSASETISFQSEGRDRVYQIQVPPSEAGTALPVVLNWHGLGSNGTDQIAFSDYAIQGSKAGYIVVAPTGVPSPGDTRNSWEVLAEDADPERDDVQFANDLLDHVIANRCVDQNRVYSTGMSNGGYFTSVLICEMADRIAAAASVAGLVHHDDCQPSRPVDFIAFHGQDDTTVPYDGGGETSLSPGEIFELMIPAIPDEFAEFATQFGCSIEPVVNQISDDVTEYSYTGCDDDNEMSFYGIANAGHTWPGSIISLMLSESSVLGVTTDQVSATTLSLEFFERHTLDE